VRLEHQGFLRACWDVTETNRKARFYSLTEPGRRRLEAERAGWERTASIMRRLLEELG
jgi:DNA-binding PadR family transcriptional regulator